MEDADKQMLEAAETLILCSLLPFSRPPVTICDVYPLNPSKPSTNLEMIPSSFLPPWGLRSRRSRCCCISKQEQEDQSSAPVDATRPSPATPLDFASTYLPSTSGSDDAPSQSAIPTNNRRRAGDSSVALCDVDQKVSGVGQAPLAGMGITSTKPVRLGKRKMFTELQAQERLLVDENTMLRMRVESKRKELEALIAENRRLQCKKGYDGSDSSLYGTGGKKSSSGLEMKTPVQRTGNPTPRRMTPDRARGMEAPRNGFSSNRDLSHCFYLRKSSPQHSRAADEAAKPQFCLPDLNEPAMAT
ncbi:uncharacterized protein LOC110020119 [Phalaenopsis equestris]|uniref:uncharacterized protein LOC110020119 n=1 Tax=Phalaenopsis equestris TaxID=78828 RepID=UPI0009E5DDD8|nr:uncharacterized protein LOC110020119 [Phalaenopsis equestris]